MTPHRVYVAGPMTGWPDYNLPAFDRAGAELAERGYVPLNPAMHGADDPNRTWADYMRRALGMLVHADGVALLPDWDTSRGARLEHSLALELGMPSRPLAQWLHGDPAPLPPLRPALVLPR